jgi:hypothetical protein
MKIIVLIFLVLLSVLIVAGFIIQILYILRPVAWLFVQIVRILIKPVVECVHPRLGEVRTIEFSRKLLAHYSLKGAYGVRFLPCSFIIARYGFFSRGKVVEASIRAMSRI